MSKKTTNVDCKVKNNWIIVAIVIWAMLLISILSIFVLAHFLRLISNNIGGRIAYVLVASCVMIIITAIICLTIIICKCLTTGFKRINPYDEALTKMLAPYDDKGTKGNNNSNNESTSS